VAAKPAEARQQRQKARLEGPEERVEVISFSIFAPKKARAFWAATQQARGVEPMRRRITAT
jgi:hypothetical protein